MREPQQGSSEANLLRAMAVQLHMASLHWATVPVFAGLLVVGIFIIATHCAFAMRGRRCSETPAKESHPQQSGENTDAHGDSKTAERYRERGTPEGEGLSIPGGQPGQSPWSSGSVGLCVILGSIYTTSLITFYMKHGCNSGDFSYGILFLGMTLLCGYAVDVVRLLVLRVAGFTDDDIALASGPRHLWTFETVSYFLQKYSERTVKIVDAINRRVGHATNNTVQYAMFIPWIVPNQRLRVGAVLVAHALGMITKTALVDSNGITARITFQGARIRDGSLGRVNLVVVKFVSAASIPLLHFVILHMHTERAEMPFISMYAFMPLIWGDTMAEVVGSFFGRLEFNVYGFGEINKKTVEGTVACWLASFLACTCVTSFTAFPAHVFAISMAMLNALASTVATVAEVASVRGTDNGFMLLSVVCVLVYFSGGVQWELEDTYRVAENSPK